MRNRIILGAALGVLLLVVGGIAIALASIDHGRFKGQIAAAVERATGRRLAMDGPMRLSLLPRPALSIKDVALANAAWGSRPQMLMLGSVSVEVEFWPLLISRALHVTRLVIADADLLLETDAEGRGNWDLASAAAPDTGGDAGDPDEVDETRRLLEFGELRLERASVTYRDGGGGPPRTLAVAQASLTSTPDRRVALRAEASYRDQPVKLAATMDRPTGFLAPGGPFVGQLDVTLPGTVAKLSGRLAEARAARGLELAVSVEAEPLEALSRLFDTALPAAKFTLAAQVSGDLAGTLRASGVRANLGGSDLTGTLALDRSGARPLLAADLAAARLDLVEMLPPAAPAAEAPAKEAAPPVPPPPPGRDGRLFSDAAFRFDGLRGLDADISLRVATLRMDPEPLEQVTLRVVMENGDLALRPFAFTLAGSHVAGDARVNARVSPPALALDLAAQRIDIGRVLQRFAGIDFLVAKGDLVVNVRGAGTSLRAVMAALEGNASLVVGQGTLAAGYAEALGLGALRAALPAAQRVADARLNCAIARFDIARGVAHSKSLVLDAGDLTMLGTGSINLGTETLALDLAPRVRIAGVPGLVVPVSVRGTLLEPSVNVAAGRGARPNPLVALGAIVLDPGASRTNPCGGLAEPPPARAPIPGQSGGPARDLGGAIQRLLR